MAYDIVLLFLIFFTYLAFNKYESSREKKELIKQITIALKSSTVVEYKDNVDEEKIVQLVKPEEDEFMNIEDVDPDVLLKALK